MMKNTLKIEKRDASSSILSYSKWKNEKKKKKKKTKEKNPYIFSLRT